MSIQQMLLGTSGLLSFNVIIAADTTNYNLLTILQAAPFNYNNISPANITLTINSAVQVSSTSTGTPALTTGAITSNAALAIINNGSIKGKGGAGGAGGIANYPDANAGSAGASGGVALNIASTLSGKVTITNGSGEIFGGGGGGGGGGSNTSSGSGKDPQSSADGGGGGGGGAGSGAGGAGGTASGAVNNTNAPAGSAGTTSAGGAGGPKSGNADGGAGGGFGAVGSAGQEGGSAGGAGGAAGKAIALNGGSSPTFISGNDGTHIKGAVS